MAIQLQIDSWYNNRARNDKLSAHQEQPKRAGSGVGVVENGGATTARGGADTDPKEHHEGAGKPTTCSAALATAR